jgi:glycosyltransferase involved in cell wall biosynthesis
MLRRSLDIPDEAMILFSLGRFTPAKGFDTLLLAFAKLPRTLHARPLYLVIAGDGPLRHRLHSQGRALRLDSRLRWAGWQYDPSPYFDLADVFVCPSRHEPLGNVILEAWAHRLPVVATRTHGALELITDSDDGVLVPCDDPGMLAGRLLELLEAGSRPWRRMGEAGAQTLAANHSREAVVRAYLALYKDLVEQGPRPSHPPTTRSGPAPVEPSH